MADSEKGAGRARTTTTKKSCFKVKVFTTCSSSLTSPANLATAVTTVVVSISLPQSLSICNVSKSLARANFPRKSVDRECGRYDSSADGNIIAWARL